MSFANAVLDKEVFGQRNLESCNHVDKWGWNFSESAPKRPVGYRKGPNIQITRLVLLISSSSTTTKKENDDTHFLGTFKKVT